MLKKILLLLFAVFCGLLTISLLPLHDLNDPSFIMANLILNPVRFFLGMTTFIITVLVLSTFIKSAIEQTFYWMKGESGFHAAIVIDYGSFACYLLFFERSWMITIFLVIFAVIFAVSSLELKKDISKERSY